MTSNAKITAVVPLFNEADSLEELYLQLSEVLKGRDYEIIFVDDGSRDNSPQILHQLAQKDPRVGLLTFLRNQGKSEALAEGFSHARGEVIVTLDADLQDDPYEIPNLVQKLEQGYDLVSGWKIKRQDPLSKTIPSKFFNWVTAKLSGIPLHDFNCGLKAYRREVIENIKVYGQLHRFIPVLAKMEGYRIGEVKVRHHPRKYGKTKFGTSRFLYGFLDLLTVLYTSRYTRRPLHLFGTVGVLSLIIGIIINLYLSYGWLMGQPIGNRPLFFLGILLTILGVQLFSIGLLGEMITRMGPGKVKASKYVPPRV